MQTHTDDFNVVFIISDQHRQDTSGCYGNSLIKTPNIDRLASQSVRFEQVYCPSPLCGPSRAAIMTGTHPHTCGLFTHQQDESIRDIPTLGSVFRKAGCVTGAIGKVHIVGEGADRDLGYDERGMRCYTNTWRDYIEAVGAENADKYASYRKGGKGKRKPGYNPTNEPIELEEEYMYDTIVTERCIDFMTRHQKERFFLWAGLEKPHPELYAPEEFHRLYDPQQMPLPETMHDEPGPLPHTLEGRYRPADNMTEEQMRHCVAAYHANVSYLDLNVGRILDAVKRLGLSERTIIVYTSDHGENLFAHGLLQKHCFYETAVAVPLLLSVPGATPADDTCNALVSLIDLMPTLLDLTGISHPAGLEGRSLLGAMQGESDPEDTAVFAEFYSYGVPERMIRTPQWKYICTHGDISQLYDVQADPLERTNLAASPEYSEVCAELDKRIRDGWEHPPDGYKCRRRGRRK